MLCLSSFSSPGLELAAWCLPACHFSIKWDTLGKCLVKAFHFCLFRLPHITSVGMPCHPPYPPPLFPIVSSLKLTFAPLLAAQWFCAFRSILCGQLSSHTHAHTHTHIQWFTNRTCLVLSSVRAFMRFCLAFFSHTKRRQTFFLSFVLCMQPAWLMGIQSMTHIWLGYSKFYRERRVGSL